MRRGGEITKTITAFTNDPISFPVEYGTGYEEAQAELPPTVKAEVSIPGIESLVDVSVLWATTATYTTAIPSVYVYTAEYAEGEKAGESETDWPAYAIVVCDENGEAPPDAPSEGEPNVAYVALGTSEEEAKALLPSTLEVKRISQPTTGVEQIHVSWSCANYDPLKPAPYEFTAAFAPPDGVEYMLADDDVSMPKATVTVRLEDSGDTSGQLSGLGIDFGLPGGNTHAIPTYGAVPPLSPVITLSIGELYQSGGVIELPLNYKPSITDSRYTKFTHGANGVDSDDMPPFFIFDELALIEWINNSPDNVWVRGAVVEGDSANAKLVISLKDRSEVVSGSVLAESEDIPLTFNFNDAWLAKIPGETELWKAQPRVSVNGQSPFPAIAKSIKSNANTYASVYHGSTGERIYHGGNAQVSIDFYVQGGVYSERTGMYHGPQTALIESSTFIFIDLPAGSSWADGVAPTWEKQTDPINDNGVEYDRYVCKRQVYGTSLLGDGCDKLYKEKGMRSEQPCSSDVPATV